MERPALAWYRLRRLHSEDFTMKKAALFLLLALPLTASAQNQNQPTTLRGVLLAQYHSTHDKEEWFVPAKVAVAGLTADQANWTPGKGQHSVGQLAYHLWYWNARALQNFKGEKQMAFSGNNDETFDKFDPAQWEDLQKKLDQVMTEWERPSKPPTIKSSRRTPG